MATEHGRSRRVGNTDTLGPRIVAYFIDSIIVSVILAVVAGLGVVLGAAIGGSAGGLISFLFIMLGVVVGFGYKIYFEANGGQPFGKQMMNIKVVMDDGRDCTMGGAIIRNLLLGIEGGLIALIVILVTDKSQRIGDLVGSTVVVKA